MQQIPSVDWPRRTNPLLGNEDLLKQNPSGDAFPQEERIPSSLISDYVLSNISPSNVGSGIGTFDSKINGNIRFRSIQPNSSKVSIGLSNQSIVVDVNATIIANSINLTDLHGISAPTLTNQFLQWNGSSYVFSSITPYAISVRDTFNTSVSFSNNSTLSIYGTQPIVTTFDNANRMFITFNGQLHHLSDVLISGSTPNGYVLGWNSGDLKWEPVAPTSSPSYTFNIKADASGTQAVNNASTLKILGNGIINTSITGTDEITIGWTANLANLSDVNNTSPLNNQVLGWNSGTSKWEPHTITTATPLVQNGLSLSGSTIQLGGFLTKDTSVSGSAHTFLLQFPFLKNFYVETQVSGHNYFLSSNQVTGLNQYVATKNSSSDTFSITQDSANSYMSFDAKVGTTTKRFRVRNTLSEGGLFYELSGVKKSGFFVNENTITVMDGVHSAPSAGHVLTFTASGTTEFLPISASGLGDDWGNQVVQHNSSLTGNGTIASPLAVTNPIPSGWTEGMVLTIAEGTPNWVTPLNQEFVGICEIENGSEVSIMTGHLYFVVPPQLNTWKIRSYVAAVFVVGSGSTTSLELMKNGVTIGSSSANITSQYITKSSINATVATGDRISINITNAKTVKDKGLSVTIQLSP